MKKYVFITAWLFLPLLLLAQHRISGTVRNGQTGEPVEGATIRHNRETIFSGVNGTFSLAGKPGDRLVVSHVGFSELEVSVPDTGDLVISMFPRIATADSVIVTGYTTQRRVDLTGSVAVVNMAQVKDVATNNPLAALQGRVAGVYVSMNGNPNGNASIRIRGNTTLNDNNPLIIMDGIPVEIRLNEINTNDIESMQVLKDPSSASIYGARASNGVIIITTRKGVKGRTKIDVSSSLTTQRYTTAIDMLNTEQRGRVLWQAAINDGVNPSTLPIYKYNWHTDANGVAVLDQVIIPTWLDSAGGIKAANTNWFDEISRTGFIQNYNVALSRGSDNGAVLFSVGYFNNQGVIKTNDYNRITLRLNSDYRFFNNRLRIGENVSVSKSNETPMGSGAGGTPVALGVIVQPIIPVYTTGGGWGGPFGAGFDDRDNPVRLLYDNEWDNTERLQVIGNVFAELSVLKDLTLRSNFGVQYEEMFLKDITKKFKSGFLSSSINSLNIQQQHVVDWTWNNTLAYSRTIGKHRAGLLVGTEAVKSNANTFSAYREGFAIESPDYFYLEAGTGISSNSGNAGGFTLLSYFGKLNYTYDDRYLVSGTIRNDGSSRFGRSNRFGVFPAFSLGWRISQEEFMKDLVPSLSELKLRYGWGKTGNQRIDNNAALGLYRPNYGADNSGGPASGTAYAIGGQDNGTLPSGYYPFQRANPNLKWEETTGINYGIDFGFFGNRLTGSVDFFSRKTTGILISPSYAAVLGEGGRQWYNGASMKNTGFDILLESKTDIGPVQLDLAANLSHWKDRITGLPVEVVGSYPGNVEKTILGRSSSAIFGYIADGIFQNAQEVAAHATQTGKAVGRIRYRDLNKDGVIDTRDQDFIGVAQPDFIYGLNAAFSYKNFSLSFFFQGVQGMELSNDYSRRTDFSSMYGGSNYGTRTLQAWTPQNPNSTIPALSLTDKNNETRQSTYFIQNGSYLKWRNLMLSYSLPAAALPGWLGSLRVYVQGENLSIFKDNKGVNQFTAPDPENPNSAFPRPLMLTFGINTSF